MKATLIGAGQIARQHLACLRELPGVEIVGICDRLPVVAESAAERFGIRHWFTDHRKMLEETRPDVVHITTPPTSHYRLAVDAIDAGAHVVVEKPATETLADLEALVARAREKGRSFVEDYNYQFNRATREIVARLEAGEFGAVVHVEVTICLDILGPDGFADQNTRHPALALPGGAIADFLPHLASLAYLFVGPHKTAHAVYTKRKASILPYDEFHAVVEAERGTASLAFSATSQPDAFWLRVYGEKMQATTNLFETRLTFERTRAAPKPLVPLLNGLEEARAIRGAAIGNLLRKFGSGPGAYDGLWELLSRFYRALSERATLPVTLDDVLGINRMVFAMQPGGQSR